MLDGDLCFPVRVSLGTDTDLFGATAGASSYLSKARLTRVSSRPGRRLGRRLVGDWVAGLVGDWVAGLGSGPG